MEKLEQNIINLHGEIGREWLNTLPTIINKLATLWSLTEIKPVNNMSWNFVALAICKQNYPVALKISCDKKLITDEYHALRHFDGHGAIKALEFSTQYKSLLLEQAVPGHTLKTSISNSLDATMNCYAKTVKALADRPLLNDHFTHVSSWCNAIDRVKSPQVSKCFLQKARELKSFLLDSADQEYLCHGDLHLENILKHGENWLAIDPKGIIGEMAFEAAAFDLVSDHEMQHATNVSALLHDRIMMLANKLGLDSYRLLGWIFLRIIISAQWFIEDNGDPSHMLTLATYIYPLLISTK